MRFIHMADVHLGAVPDSGCPWSAFRENEIWETILRPFGYLIPHMKNKSNYSVATVPRGVLT